MNLPITKPKETNPPNECKKTTILETIFDRLIQKLFRKDDFLSHFAINCNISKYLPGIFKKQQMKRHVMRPLIVLLFIITVNCNLDQNCITINSSFKDS